MVDPFGLILCTITVEKIKAGIIDFVSILYLGHFRCRKQK